MPDRRTHFKKLGADRAWCGARNPAISYDDIELVTCDGCVAVYADVRSVRISGGSR